MQCFRCKAYGHRSGDKECPLLKSGNLKCESERKAREDPMAEYLSKNCDSKKEEKLERIRQWQEILNGLDSGCSSDSSSDEKSRKKKKSKSRSKKSKKRRSRTPMKERENPVLTKR